MEEEARWEYCFLDDPEAVDQASGTRQGRATYCGESVDSMDVAPQHLPYAIGKLGGYGWELVGVTDHVLYFKRQVKEGRKTSEPALVL
jgi:hypothetical protein